MLKENEVRVSIHNSWYDKRFGNSETTGFYEKYTF